MTELGPWIDAQVARLRALRGRRVLRWYGTEMAVREEGSDGYPVFTDATVPYLQLYWVRLECMTEDAIIQTYQSDDVWGLHLRDDTVRKGPYFPDEEPGFFRSRVLHELPKGEIEHVALVMCDDSMCDVKHIAEVTLYIAGRRVRLFAAEVYEEADGTLRIVLMDESVLVEVDGRRP